MLFSLIKNYPICFLNDRCLNVAATATTAGAHKYCQIITTQTDLVSWLCCTQTVVLSQIPKSTYCIKKKKKKLSPWLSVRLLCPKLYRRGGGRDYRFSVYSRAVLGKRGICCHDKYWFITFRRVIITCELLSLKACQEKKKKKKKVDAPVCSLFSPLPRRKILAFYECQAISFSHKNGNSSEGEDHFFLVVRFLT